MRPKQVDFGYTGAEVSRGCARIPKPVSTGIENALSFVLNFGPSLLSNIRNVKFIKMSKLNMFFSQLFVFYFRSC